MDLLVGQGTPRLRLSWATFLLFSGVVLVEKVWKQLEELELADSLLRSWTPAQLVCPPCPCECSSEEFSPPGLLGWLIRLVLR